MTRLLRLSAAAALVLAGCPTNPPQTSPDTGGADPCAACTADQVCEARACRYKDCKDLGCGAHQACTAATAAAPARCEPSCLDGYVWDAAAKLCVAAGCEQLGCAGQNRECVGEEGARSCGGCLKGFAEDATSKACVTWATCEATPVQASISNDCAAQHRLCLENFPGQASCTDCLDGYVEVNTACEEKVTCAEAHCEYQDRLCDEEPNAHCVGCIPGKVEDATTKQCRDKRTCADVAPTCKSGERCFESSTGGDAECKVASDCGTDRAPTLDGSCSEPCPDCTGEGADGPYLAKANLFNKCICKTDPGYFYDTGMFAGVRACDADHDGWTKVQAKAQIESADEVQKMWARCELRTIDRYVLHNVRGQALTVKVAPVGLYESQRNDEQALLDNAYDAAKPELPAYPGSRLAVEELNSLTKYCVSPSVMGQRVDFNDNGRDDVDEWQRDPSMVDPNDPLKAFSNFSYFAELHRGWYAPPAGGTGPGSYHIQEKSRLAGATEGLKVALTYGDLGGKDYWRQCDLQRDSAWRSDNTKEAGMDYGQYDGATPEPGDELAGLPEWTGMNLGSQFKCLKIVASLKAESLPNEITKADAEAGYKVNACTKAGVSGPGTLPAGAPSDNPSEPQLTCALTPVVDPGLFAYGSPAYLAAANYQPYVDQFNLNEPNSGYVRGCVNECAEYPGSMPAWGKVGCPGYSSDPHLNRAQCLGDRFDFGRLVCGCAVNSLGLDCEVSCANANLMTKFTSLNPRKGYQLCGRPALTGVVPLRAASDAGVAPYLLSAEIGAQPSLPVKSCSPDYLPDAGYDAGAAAYCLTR